MKFIWLKESQRTDWGLIKKGDEIDAGARGIPNWVVKSWIADGWAKQVKPKVRKSIRGGKNYGRGKKA